MRNTIEYLTDPVRSKLYLPSVVAGLGVALLGSVLSVLVTLKRLAFVGQGVSHAGFGGIGLAAALGFAATSLSPAPHGGVPQFLVVFGFCLVASLLIGWMAHAKGGATRDVEPDTAIGIVLVASMALGALLMKHAGGTLASESYLFGSILGVTYTDAAIAWGVALLVLGSIWLMRRRLLFWAFDEQSSAAFGVSGAPIGIMLFVLLALATVTAMRLVGVVLATAMLVLPGAIAIRLSRRWGVVLGLSVLIALAGVVGGLLLSFERDWLPGPSIVLVLSTLFAITLVLPVVRRAAGPALSPEAAPEPGKETT